MPKPCQATVANLLRQHRSRGDKQYHLTLDVERVRGPAIALFTLETWTTGPDGGWTGGRVLRLNAAEALDVANAIRQELGLD